MQKAIPKQELQLECAAHYDPENVMYTVNATVDLTNLHPLVSEALFAHGFSVDAMVIEIPVDDTVPSSRFTTLPQVCPEMTSDA